MAVLEGEAGEEDDQEEPSEASIRSLEHEIEEAEAWARHPAVIRSRGRVSSPNTQRHQQTDRRFNVASAVRSIAEGKQLSGYEAECNQELTRGLSMRPNSFILPFGNMETRSNEITTTTGGGIMTYSYGEYLDKLRKASIIDKLGIKTRLVNPGRYWVPRETTNTVASWSTENVPMNQSPVVVDYIETDPYQLSVFTTVTRTLLASSSYGVSEIIEEDMAKAIGEQLNYSIIAGSGSAPQPCGVLNQAAVDVVSLTSGYTYQWLDALTVESAVLQNNPPEGAKISSITSPLGQKVLKNTAKIGSTFPNFILENDQMNGHDVVASNHMVSNLSYSGNGSMTAIATGCWSEAVEVVMWGGSPSGGSGILCVVDPFTAGQSGNINIYSFLFCNTVWRRPSLMKVQMFK
jgi:HK97 family phage major capsid protein